LLALYSQKLPDTDALGNELMDIKYFKGHSRDVNVAVGIFGQTPRHPRAIIVAIKAKPGPLSFLNIFSKVILKWGSIRDKTYTLYTATVPIMEALQDLFASLPPKFPITFIGHAEGGAIATLFAMEFAETFANPEVTLVTINSPFAWNNRFTLLVDQTLDHVYRWREGHVVSGDEGNVNETNEIWYVYRQVKCCPQPETPTCKRERGKLVDIFTPQHMTFHGFEVFGDGFCAKLTSPNELPPYNS
jgi:hypothetical protein